MSKDASTYNHFLGVAAGLRTVAEHIRPLQEALRRDEAELQRMQVAFLHALENVIDDLRDEVRELESQIKGLRDELESVQK